jgi:hypothetical protein
MTDSPYLRKPELHEKGFNYAAKLPYGLTVDEVKHALENVYRFLHDLNNFLIGSGYERLEEMILGNSLSGFISEMVVKNLGASSKTLARNTKVGGHPDLIPRGKHPGESILRGEEGIEIKTSIQSGGWQGHNPEKTWVIIVQYSVDVVTEPIEERRPIEILKVMSSLLEEEDWSFSGRKGESRRTPTASIIKSGTDKLHTNFIYQHPQYVRNLEKMAEQLRQLHLAPSQFEEEALKVPENEEEAEREVAEKLIPPGEKGAT